MLFLRCPLRSFCWWEGPIVKTSYLSPAHFWDCNLTGGSGSKLGSGCWCFWFLQGAVCLCWEVGQGNGTCQLLCSWRSLPKISVPLEHTLSWVNNFPSHRPQMFFKLLFLCCISSGYVLCCIFKGRDSVSSCSPSSPRTEFTDF